MSRLVLTPAQMRAHEARAVAAGADLYDLMRRAGTGAAHDLMRRYAPRPTLMLAGPGNNGGDGVVVAHVLAQAGWPVRLTRLGAAAVTAEPARQAWAMASQPVEPADPRALGTPALIVDALFGAGLNCGLSGEAAALADAVNASDAVRVALDLPSGWDGLSARADGPAVRADLTYAFGAFKPAHVLEPAASACGDSVVIDIGTPDDDLTEADVSARMNHPALWVKRWPRPDAVSHKHNRGRLGVLSGPPGATGAARLAALAGQRIGAGWTALFGSEDAIADCAGHMTSILTRTALDPAEIVRVTEGYDAVVIGPGAGVGPSLRETVVALKQAGRRLVVDADALTAFQDAPDALFAVMEPCDVLTPHQGEFDRLFPDLRRTMANKIEAARMAARRAGAVVVLKGADTVIAAPDGGALVNRRTSPWLASAGTGDLLAGFLGGLLAQAMPSFDAAAGAVWLHGDIARRFGPGLIAEDLLDGAPAALDRLLSRPGSSGA